MNYTEWINYLARILPRGTREKRVVCIAENMEYEYLVKDQIYRIITFTIDRELELVWLYVLTEEDYQNGYISPRKYSSRYFTPLGDYEIELKKCEECNQEFNPIYLTNTTFIDTDNKLTCKSLCRVCLSSLQINTCYRCGIRKINTPFIKGLNGCYCSECIKSAKLITCANCKKKRITFLNDNIFGNKYRNKLCNKCNSLGFDELQTLFNTGKIRYEEDDEGHEIRNYDIFWYIKKLGTNERTFGLEFEVSTKTTKIQAMMNIKKELSRIKVYNRTLADFLIAKYDGSLDNKGIEFNSIVLAGEKSFEYMDIILKVIKKYCYVNKFCGLHLHIGVRDYDYKGLAKLYYFYNRFQRQFKYYVTPNRLRNHYCKRLPTKSVKELLDGHIYPQDRYRAVNFLAFREFGTIELRILEGTFDFEKIKTWVNLHLKIIESIKHDDSIFLTKWKLPQKSRHLIGNALYLDLRKRVTDYKEKNLTPKQREKRIESAMNFLKED